ncbi:MAG: hypothetical protein AAF456_00185 [Planctomycetota bacterium]
MTTLRAFQNGPGIHGEDQILLIDNPRFAEGFRQCLRFCTSSFDKTRLGRSLYKLMRKTGVNRILQGVALPQDQCQKLFLGRPHRSFKDVSLLPRLFDKIGRQSEREFVLILGKGDYIFTEQLASAMPPNLVGVAVNNADLENDRVLYLPMGRDFRSLDVFRDFPPAPEKTLTAYCNFSLSTHPVRAKVFEMLKDRSFVEFDHMGKFRSYPISRSEFFAKLRASRFSICPRGNAIDTFRMWDSMYVGTIPIVVKEARYHDQLQDLPILFLDSYDQFGELTEGFLIEKYQEFLDTEFNYEKLNLGFWVKQLEDKLTKNRDPDRGQPQSNE